MDWNDLRYFLAIHRAGTLVKAGRELGVEHTTVGRRLAALEGALGVRLFARGPEGLALTSAGQDILASAEAMSDQAQAIERRVSGADSRVEGKVKVTIPEAVTSYMIHCLMGLRELHPGLVVEILTENREVDLRRGEADLAIRFRDVTDPELVGRKIGRAAWSVYASEGYLARKGPVSSSGELAGHDVIAFDGTLAQLEAAIWLEKHGRGANVVFRGNSITAVLNAAVMGLGIGALPCSIGDREASLVRVTQGLVGVRDISLVVHPDLLKVARVRAAMDHFIEWFARDAELWNGELPHQAAAAES